MHHGSNIYTIYPEHNSAPPSYAEAMQQSRPNSSDHRTSYNQEYSQMPSYPVNPQSNRFYSHVQPIYDTTRPNQHIQTTSTTALTNRVIIGPREEKPIFTCCRIIWTAGVFITMLIIFIMIIQRFNK